MDGTRPLFGVISEPAIARFKMASSWSSAPSIAAKGRFLVPTEGGLPYEPFMDRTSAGVNARWAFNGLPFGVMGLFLAKADEGGAPIRTLGERFPRTRLGDTLSGDWDTSLLENGASLTDSATVDRVPMLAVRVAEIAKQNTVGKIMGRCVSKSEADRQHWPNQARKV
jgi:hypothetical protein